MRGIVAGAGLVMGSVWLTGCGVAGVFQAKQLPPEASATLAAMPFDAAPVTVRGRITMALFGVPGTASMITVESTTGPEKYVFLTAPTRDMAKQGFTRNSIGPGNEITVTGVSARDHATIEDFLAARADSIALSDGKVVFDRSDLP